MNAIDGKKGQEGNVTDELSSPETKIALPCAVKCQLSANMGCAMHTFALSINSRCQMQPGRRCGTTSELASGFRSKLPLEIIAILPGNFRWITRCTCIRPSLLHQASESVRSTGKHPFFCSSYAQFWDKMARVRLCVSFPFHAWSDLLLAHSWPGGVYFNADPY